MHDSHSAMTISSGIDETVAIPGLTANERALILALLAQHHEGRAFECEALVRAMSPATRSRSLRRLGDLGLLTKIGEEGPTGSARTIIYGLDRDRLHGLGQMYLALPHA